MKLGRLAIFMAVAVLAMLAISAWAWGQVPDHAQIPIHWGLDGRPDGYGPKWAGLLMMPGMGAILAAVFLVIPRFEPRREHLEASAQAWIAITGSAMLLLVVVHAALVLSVLGARIDIGRVLGVALGGLLIVIGNFLGKTRSNWLMGVRTPWTLSSERSWARTHRLGGRLFVALGIVSVVLGLLTRAEVVFFGVLPGLVAASILLVVYSYLVWRADPDRQAL